MNEGCVIWLTGLSGAGKSTLALALKSVISKEINNIDSGSSSMISKEQALKQASQTPLPQRKPIFGQWPKREFPEAKIEILDGDEVRENLSKGLGFSKEDRDTNVKRIGYVSKLLSRNGVIVIVASISPYRDVRNSVKESVTNFVEIYCDCPIEDLKIRDPKGLYKKVESGEIKNFTGISDPYEPPISPDVHLYTNNETVEESIDKIISYIKESKLL